MDTTESELALDEMRVVLIDGVCKSCHFVVRRVHARDEQGLFRFATQQSELGQRLIAQHGLEDYEDQSIILLDRGEVFTLSTAALRILSALPGLNSWFGVLLWIPRGLRDLAYRAYAINRHRLFGKLESCQVPDPDLRARFLDL